MPITSITKKELIDFESEIAEKFNKGLIRSPIHLYNGNEDQIIKFFSRVKKEDWVFCTWRSHYQCLLKGVSKFELKKEIIEGKSISLCFPKYKIYSSAIVGGNLPIALGVAMGNKYKKNNSKVYCFVGDMSAETGIMYETLKYATNFNLPIHFIIEDNNLSVCTNTRKVWKSKRLLFEKKFNKFITRYKYKNKYPHSGAGVMVKF